jgi:hypothetical protein
VRKAADAYIAAAYAEEAKRQEAADRKLALFDAGRDEELRRLLSEKIIPRTIFRIPRKRTLDEALAHLAYRRGIIDASMRSPYRPSLDVVRLPHLHAAEGMLVALDAAGGAAALQIDTGSPEFAVIRWHAERGGAE